MSDWQRPLKAGDGAIPATAFNAAVQGGLLALRAKGGVRRGAMGPGIKQPATELLIKWTGEEPLPVRSVVTYADAVISPEDKPLAVAESPIFEAGTPATSTDAFAITIAPCRANKYARAVSVGIAVVDIDVTDEAHTHANATPDETAYLTSAESGRAEILWKPEGTGVGKCVVLLGGGGGSGCEGSVCTDYQTYTSSGLTRDYTLGGSQTQVIHETLTNMPTGTSVVINAGILAGPSIFTAAPPGCVAVFGRLVKVDSAGAVTGVSSWLPLGHFQRLIATNELTITAVSFDQNPTLTFFDSTPRPRSARQGVVSVRKSFDSGDRVAWQVMPLGVNSVPGIMTSVYGIGSGPTYIVVMTGCGECSPTEPTTTVPTPPAPPPPPSSIAVSFVARPMDGPAPLAVAFTDTSTGSPNVWRWDFGNGNGSALQHPTYTYDLPGLYTVTLTASNAALESGTASAQISVWAKGATFGIPLPLRAKLAPDKLAGTAPLAVGFSNQSKGGVEPRRYQLHYGDGAVNTDPDALAPHTYAEPGTYTATLVAIDAGGLVSLDTAVIVVELPPAAPGDGSLTANFGAAPPFATPPYTATFTDTSGTTGAAITGWAWTFGDGGTSSLQNPTHDYPGPGTYHVTLTVSHATDSDTAETDIVIP